MPGRGVVPVLRGAEQSADVPADYDASPDTAGLPLDPAEVAALLADGGRALRDQRRLTHFLQRVQVSLAAAHTDIARLHRHVQQQSVHRERVGQPTTLHPRDAVRYLPEEELEGLFTYISQQRLRTLARLVADAQGRRDELVGDLERIRAAAAELTVADDVPPAARARFGALLQSLPDDVDPVHVPPMLGYGDPAGADLSGGEAPPGMVGRP